MNNCNSKTVHSSYRYHHSSTSYTSSSSSTSYSSSSTTGNKGRRNVDASSSSRLANVADSTGRCAVSFVPRENGVHQVHVRQNAVPVAGSPFNVLVGKPDADPAKVGAYGEGLSKGRTRTLPWFFIYSFLFHQYMVAKTQTHRHRIC